MKTTTVIIISFVCALAIIVGAVLKIEGSKWSSTVLWIGLGLQLGLVAFLIGAKLRQGRQTTRS